MNTAFASVMRVLCLVFGLLLLFDALILLFISNIHTGHFLALIIAASLIMLGVFFKKIPLPIKLAYGALAALTLIFCLALLLYGIADTSVYNEDAVIVLGAGVKGKTPSVSLAGRLNTAYEYYQKNNNAVIVVSGGRGPQEDITEAQAMADYLKKLGVESDRILLEEHATSSRENFVYSKKLLDEYFEGNYTVTFITNEYHIYRSCISANNAGYSDITHLHSSTRVYTLIPNILRECVATVKQWVL